MHPASFTVYQDQETTSMALRYLWSMQLRNYWLLIRLPKQPSLFLIFTAAASLFCKFIRNTSKMIQYSINCIKKYVPKSSNLFCLHWFLEIWQDSFQVLHWAFLQNWIFLHPSFHHFLPLLHWAYATSLRVNCWESIIILSHCWCGHSIFFLIQF